MASTSSGSLYRVHRRHLSQIKLFSQLDCLSPPEKKFVLALIELCFTLDDSNDENIDPLEFTRTQLQSYLKEKGLAAGLTIIKRRSNELVKIGLFRREKFQRPKCKPADLFVLCDATDVVGKDTHTLKYEDHRPHRKNLNEIKTQLIEADEQILGLSHPIRIARSERLWNGVFGSCMRSSRNDPRRNEPFSTVYRIGQDKIEVITSSQTDSEICHVDDQRTIRAIITLVCIEVSERLELAKPLKNEFFIDIVNLCDIMGLDGSGANRDTIRDSMKRLYSTNFNLKLDPRSDTGHRFAEQFDITPGADDLNFRFLTEMDSSIDRHHGGGSIRRPRWYRIALHSKTFQDITNINTISTFIDNKEILKVSSGLIHIFYTWCSIHAKRSGYRKIRVTLPDLQRQMIPAARYDNFKERFIVALKAHQKNTGIAWKQASANKIYLFGYIILFEIDEIHDYAVSAYRDKNDPIIGDQSLHNKLLSATADRPDFLISETEQ